MNSRLKNPVAYYNRGLCVNVAGYRHSLQGIRIGSLQEGDMGVYGIAVLGIFSCGISVILVLTCGIAVSSSLAVCGISSFWLTVFGEI